MLDELGWVAGERIPMMRYAGRLSGTHPAVAAAPLNTDDRPVIEHRAPINDRRDDAGRGQRLVSQRLLDFMAPFIRNDALARDACLAGVRRSWRYAIQAGYHLHVSKVHQLSQNYGEAAAAEQTVRELLQKAAVAFDDDANAAFAG